MTKIIKLSFVSVTLSLLVAGCVNPYMDLYQNATAANKAASQQLEKDLLARNEKKQKKQEAMQALINNGSAVKQQPTSNDSFASSVPLTPVQLAAKKMVSDTLVGHACNNNFNFEIKFIGTEGNIDVELHSKLTH
jgi:hypothetical protein